MNFVLYLIEVEKKNKKQLLKLTRRRGSFVRYFIYKYCHFIYIIIYFKFENKKFIVYNSFETFSFF
jgi:hypothetical protein